MFKLHFLTNNRPDITKESYKNFKTGKIKIWKTIKGSPKVYVRRDEEKQKQKARIMLSTIEQMSQNAVAHGPRDDKLPKEDTRKGNTPRDNQWRNKCYKCGKERHFKRECLS
jgi:hypothetical protein